MPRDPFHLSIFFTIIKQNNNHITPRLYVCFPTKVSIHDTAIYTFTNLIPRRQPCRALYKKPFRQTNIKTLIPPALQGEIKSPTNLTGRGKHIDIHRTRSALHTCTDSSLRLKIRSCSCARQAREKSVRALGESLSSSAEKREREREFSSPEICTSMGISLRVRNVSYGLSREFRAHALYS